MSTNDCIIKRVAHFSDNNSTIFWQKCRTHATRAPTSFASGYDASGVKRKGTSLTTQNHRKTSQGKHFCLFFLKNWISSGRLCDDIFRFFKNKKKKVGRDLIGKYFQRLCQDMRRDGWGWGIPKLTTWTSLFYLCKDKTVSRSTDIFWIGSNKWTRQSV